MIVPVVVLALAVRSTNLVVASLLLPTFPPKLIFPPAELSTIRLLVVPDLLSTRPVNVIPLPVNVGLFAMVVLPVYFCVPVVVTFPFRLVVVAVLSKVFASTELLNVVVAAVVFKSPNLLAVVPIAPSKLMFPVPLFAVKFWLAPVTVPANLISPLPVVIETLFPKTTLLDNETG